MPLYPLHFAHSSLGAFKPPKIALLTLSPPRQCQSPPPSARTARKPAGQYAHQRSLSGVRKVLYLFPSLQRGISFGVYSYFFK